MSQGTFYNYCRAKEDLLVAVAEELSHELMQRIEAEVLRHDDPVVRIATDVRLYLDMARDFPLFARFIVRTGIHLASPNSLVHEYLPTHLEAGFAAGRFQRVPVEVALDLISGQALVAVARLAAGGADADYPAQVISMLLRALGVSKAEAARDGRISSTSSDGRHNLTPSGVATMGRLMRMGCASMKSISSSSDHLGSASCKAL